MYLWCVAVLKFDSHPDNNKGPDPRAHLLQVLRPINLIDPNHTTKHTTDPVIVRLKAISAW